MRKYNINADKYLRVTAWLAARYAMQDKHGRRWLPRKRNGKPTRYYRLHQAFFERYVLDTMNWRG